MVDSNDAVAGNQLPVWQLEDATARFSDLVRRAREHGPQRVTVRGQDAVVVLSSADYARLAPVVSAQSLAALFGNGPFSRLEGFDAESVREPLVFREPPEP